MNYRGNIRFRYKYTTHPEKEISITKTKYFNLVKNVNVVNTPFTPKIFQIGDVIGQLIIMPIPNIEFEEVEELSDSERGTGGFGSTEKQNIVEVPTETTKKKRSRKKKNE